MTDRSAEIHDFVTTIYGDQEGYVICGLMDQAGPRGQLKIQKDFYYPEGLNDLIEWAETFQAQDVYLSPLIYGDMRKTNRDGSTNIRRIPENAISSLVVYQDSDTCPPDKFRLSPSIHVDSSSGKGQDYWVLTEPVPASRAADASRRIAIAHRQDGSDPSSWSANKFLRLLGTNTRHGFPEVVQARLAGSVYDIDEIEKAYSDVEFTEKPIMRLPEEVSYDDVQDLPEYATALDKLPSTFKMTLITDQPSPTQDRSTLRYRLLCDLFRVDGLSFEEVLAIAWHAPSSQKWRDDPRNLRGLIAEAIKAQTDVAYREGEVETVSAGELVVDLPKAERGSVSLLTDEERALAAQENDFIKRYTEWARGKLGAAYNAPYNRMSAWSILSSAFGDLGIIPSTGDSCNLYLMGLGGSGTGKSSAMRLWSRTQQEIFDQDAGWHIGNASPQALHEVLIERDGKVSVLVADEAHGWFSQVSTNQWAAGTYEALALYYDGEVPPMHRTSQGRRETSGKKAQAFFNIHMMGTLKGQMSLMNVLDTAMFFSGFIPRFAFFIGDEREITLESLRETNGDGTFAQVGYEPQARQWAAEFANTKKQLRARHKRPRIPLKMTQGALERMSLVKERATELAREMPQWELLEPCMVRFGPTVRRMASLLAMEEACDIVELKHVVLAIEAAEEFLANLFYVAARISESEWSRATDEIEAFVIAKGGEVRKEVVMRKFAARHPRDLMMQLDALHAQGRVVEFDKNKSKWLKLAKSKEVGD